MLIQRKEKSNHRKEKHQHTTSIPQNKGKKVFFLSYNNVQLSHNKGCND